MKRNDWPLFEKSMEHSFNFKSKLEEDKWNILEKNYTAFCNREKGKEKIPKIIHQLWLGKPMPEMEKNCTETVKKNKGADWEYKLWGLKDLKSLNFLDKDIFNKAADLPHQGIARQVDIARYAILYEHGGVYLDTDFLLHKNFNELLDVEFFTGIAYDKQARVFNGLFGTEPKGKIIESCLTLDSALEENPMTSTGPHFLTRKIFENIDTNPLLLPVSFFYPFPNFPHSRHLGDNYIPYLKEESICTHLWSGAWM
tara:strand:+ start:1185 stop:1949 length:765 start_codon:yes stop_codon:yes gene_type:complete